MEITPNLKTELMNPIKSSDDAEAFLIELIANGECFDPEADAQCVVFASVNPNVFERELLNIRMEEVCFFLYNPLTFIRLNLSK